MNKYVPCKIAKQDFFTYLSLPGVVRTFSKGCFSIRNSMSQWRFGLPSQPAEDPPFPSVPEGAQLERRPCRFGPLPSSLLLLVHSPDDGDRRPIHDMASIHVPWRMCEREGLGLSGFVAGIDWYGLTDWLQLT